MKPTTIPILPDENKRQLEKLIMIGTAETLRDKGMLTDSQLYQIIDKIRHSN